MVDADDWIVTYTPCNMWQEAWIRRLTAKEIKVQHALDGLLLEVEEYGLGVLQTQHHA